MKGLVEALAGGGGVQEEVVRRISERSEREQRPLNRRATSRDRVVIETREVRRVLAGDDHQLEGGSGGGRREDHERLVGEDEPLSGLLFRLGQAAPHARPSADHVPRPAPDLLRHPMRDLWDRVQLQIQVLAA